MMKTQPPPHVRRYYTVAVSARWTAFALWAVAGAIGTFAALDITSIGLFLLPVSGFVVVFIVRNVRAPIFPEILGAIEGVAANLLWGAFISHGVPRCRPGVPLTVVLSGRSGEVSSSGCINIDSYAWLVRGVVVAVTGALAYLVARKLAGRGTRATM